MTYLCKLKKKITGTKGESLIETLAALLIGVLALLLLPGAVIGATKANKAAAEQSVYRDENTANHGVTVTGFSIR